jgi:tetratricopeptide (TPR) repeat protein
MNRLVHVLFQVIILTSLSLVSVDVYSQIGKEEYLEYTKPDKHDTLRVIGFVFLGKSHRVSNPSKAIYYFDNAEKIIDRNLQKGDEHRDFYLNQLTMLYNGVGVVYRNFGNYPQALASYNKALKLLEVKVNKKVESSVLFNIGLLHTYQDDNETAYDFMQRSVNIRKEEGDTLGLVNCYRYMGRIKDQSNEVEEAIDFYKQAVSLATQAKSTLKVVKAYEYYAEVYSSRGDLIKAEELLNEGMGFISNKRKSEKYHSKMAIPLCEIYLAQGKIQKAIVLSKESIQWHEPKGAEERLVKLYQILTNSYQNLGDYKTANMWLNKRVKMDSLVLIEKNTAEVVRIEMNYLFSKQQIADSLQRVREIEISNLKLGRRDATIEKSRTRIIGLAVGIVMLVIIALFWYRNFVLKRRALKLKERDVENMSLKIKRESAWIDSLVSLNAKIKKNKVTDTEDQIAQLVDEMKDNLVVDKHRQVIAKNVEVVSIEFKNKLKERYPNLTKIEIEMCELIRLELSNLEIARIRDISQNSAKMARYRLKKKLAISPEESIFQVLKNI